MSNPSTPIRRTETRIESFDPERAERIRRDPPKLLAINECAAFLGFAPRTVRQRINDKSIPHVRLGGRVLIPLAGLLASLEARTVKSV